MSSLIYVPADIPIEYKYIDMNANAGYFDLYNKEQFRNETATYYRVFFDYNEDFFLSYSKSFGTYTTTYKEITRTNDFLYRRDLDGIFVVSFIIILFLIWAFNIVTRFVYKGGIFGKD